MQAAAIVLQPRIEVCSLSVVSQELLELFHVLLVANLLEDIPQLVMQLRQPANFLPNVMQ